MDPLTLALIGGTVVSGASSFLSARSQKKQSDKNMYLQEAQNRLNWKQQMEMYERQRSDALADYERLKRDNSPLEQMNRLRQAGLNPNLVYGKGADATVEAVRASQMPTVNREAPQSTFNAAQAIQSIGNSVNKSMFDYYDIKAKQAQTDNLAQSTALMQQESLFKQANTAKTLQDTARSKFDLAQATELKDSVIENSKLQNDKLRADTQYTLDNNQRSELANSSNVRLTLEKIITEQIAHAKDRATIELLKSQLSAVQQSVDISTYEQKLTEMGIHKSDPWYFRGMMNLINGNMRNPADKLINMVSPSGIPDYNQKNESWMMRKK